MKKTIKIAKLELSILFFAPVAWLVLIIFILQSSNRFFGLFGSYQEAIAMGNQVSNLTYAVFPATGGLFEQTMQNIYLYIPLLSMGLMSREISSGSIKLLLSSPVTVKEIIFGKYLAITFYGLLLVLVLCVYSTVGASIISHPDIGLILSGLLALSLLISTYAAIGLFMSSLTGYQVVAAISTLAVFAALQYVGSIGQEYDFIRDITYYLSIAGRTDDMLKGLISSRDVIYFITIIALFLSLSILRLKAARSPESKKLVFAKYILIILSALTIIYFSSRPKLIFYKDLTSTESRTLTSNSQAIAKLIDGPLQITTYVNLLDQNVYAGLPASRNLDLSRFDAYRRFIPDLKMDYVYYYDMTDLKNNRNMIYQGDITGLSLTQIADKVADNMGLDRKDFIPPADIRKIVDLTVENNNFVRILEYKGKRSKLRLYDELDAFPSESEISAAIKSLVVPAVKIAFITGHNERSPLKSGDRDYKPFTNTKSIRRSLVNQGFNVTTVDLGTSAITADINLLVLADPISMLRADELVKLKAYVENGGNLMINTEPGRQKVINPVLHWFGVELMNGIIVVPDTEDLPQQVTSLTPEKIPVATPTVAALKVTNGSNFKVDTLLTSPHSGWNKLGNLVDGEPNPSYEPQNGDLKGSYPTAIAIDRTINGKTQKIFISGDSDFMASKEIEQSKVLNKLFSTSVFQWFSNNEFPIDIHRPEPQDNAIMLKKKQINNLKLVFTGAIPLLIGLLGAYIILSRKRK